MYIFTERDIMTAWLIDTVILLCMFGAWYLICDFFGD